MSILTKAELREHLMLLADEINQKMEGDIAMNKRHKHADLIHAWADGAEIQKFCGDGWYDDSDTPNWFEDAEYRIKPKIVKREGWVAIYKHSNGVSHLYDRIYDSKDDADNDCPCATDTIKIEWEEEE